MKVNMLKFINKSSFFIILILFISYFFVGLFNFQEKILSLKKNKNIVNSNIVILTGGSNRIKEGLKIVNEINKLTKTDFKILISGTGKGFTKATLKKILTSDFNLKLVECCIELESISKDTYSNASETYKWTKRNNINNIILLIKSKYKSLFLYAMYPLADCLLTIYLCLNNLLIIPPGALLCIFDISIISIISSLYNLFNCVSSS